MPTYPLYRHDLTLLSGPSPAAGYLRYLHGGPGFRMSAYLRESHKEICFLFHEGPNARTEAASCAATLAPMGAELRHARASQEGREVIMPWTW